MPTFYRIISILLSLSLLTSCEGSKSLTDSSLQKEKLQSDKFRFFINADPQMGPENTERKGLKILNELLESFVDEVNKKNKKEKIDFVVYNGDLVWDPYQDAFDNFTRIVSKQEVPVNLVHGNHDGYNDDPKFFQAQQKLSGYQKLNYSFSKGEWHFVFIGAQEKYLQENQKQQQLDWIKNELKKHQDKKTMLFMHYHIMPVGLSQMEFYSYWPISFKKQILNTITQTGNVKYVFSGHVHSGIKGSVKSSLEYKGIKFINSPTPVMARPFGEEYKEFEDSPEDRYFRRGFYLEVQINGNEVVLIGHKINHSHQQQYPKKFKLFKPAYEPRFLNPEAKSKANKEILNPDFDNGLKGWNRSYRYKKDKDNAFQNTVKNSQNRLKLRSPWGSWSFDEYMETYQIVDLNLNQPNLLNYKFETPKFSKKGAGGFIKLVFFSKNEETEEMILIHWGAKEERVKLSYQSWFYNSNGNRAASNDFNQLLMSNDLLSIPIEFDATKKQNLNLDINALLQMMGQDLASSNINKMTLSHGVWARVLMKESNIKSILNVDSVKLNHKKPIIEKLKQTPVLLNQFEINKNKFDKKIPYFDFANLKSKRKAEKQKPQLNK